MRLKLTKQIKACTTLNLRISSILALGHAVADVRHGLCDGGPLKSERSPIACEKKMNEIACAPLQQRRMKDDEAADARNIPFALVDG